MPLDERVLCIPGEHFQRVGEFHGFRPADPEYRAALLDPAVFSFRPRAEVEPDPSWKQLIPYVVLRCGEMLFHYRRGRAGTEKRLESLRSIGVGGHIADTDAMSGTDPYRAGMLRELSEEIALKSDFEEHWLGFIYDDRTPVGSVHLGVVHLFELTQPAVEPREAGLADAGFAPMAELLADRDSFETWSQFLFTAMPMLRS